MDRQYDTAYRFTESVIVLKNNPNDLKCANLDFGPSRKSFVKEYASYFEQTLNAFLQCCQLTEKKKSILLQSCWSLESS